MDAETLELFNAATLEDLNGFTYKELESYAKSLGVVGPAKTKAELLTQIMAYRDASKAVEPTDEIEAIEDVITPEEARKVDTASDEQIERYIADHPEARKCLVSYMERTLERRIEERKARAEAEARRTVIRQWRVTKGAKIYPNGLPTMVPVGAIVSELTHNLTELQKAGVEAEPYEAEGA